MANGCVISNTRRSMEGSGEVDPKFGVVVRVGQSIGFDVLSQ
jgi:hypothetical protein